MDQELKIKNPQMRYDLGKSKGQKLELNGVTFDNNSFSSRLENESLNFNWDQQLVSGGDVSMINQQGKSCGNKKPKERGRGLLKNFKVPRLHSGKTKSVFVSVCVRKLRRATPAFALNGMELK